MALGGDNDLAAVLAEEFFRAVGVWDKELVVALGVAPVGGAEDDKDPAAANAASAALFVFPLGARRRGGGAGGDAGRQCGGGTKTWRFLCQRRISVSGGRG